MERSCNCRPAGILGRLRNPALSVAVLGIVSLAWLLARTGTKPSRAVYPCQRAAAANVSVWAAVAVLPVLGFSRHGDATPEGPTDTLTSETRRAAPARVFLTVALAAMIVLGGGTATDLYAEMSMANSERLQQSVRLDLESRTIGAASFSDIHVVNGTSGADHGIARLIESLEREGFGFYRRQVPDSGDTGDGNAHLAGIVGNDDVVLIKINSQWDKRGGTNTDLVRSLIFAIADHPDGFSGEVVIADNGQDQYGSRGSGGSMDWRDNNAVDRTQSITDVVDELAATVRVSAYLWDRITLAQVREYSDGDDSDGYVVADGPTSPTGIIVSYPKFTTEFGTKVSFAQGIWDAASQSYDSGKLVVINVPVLKSHSIYGVTASVKHYMGVVSDKLTGHNAHRSVATGGMGTQMAETRLPDLNIIDAVWVNARPGNGPGTNYHVATEVNVIAAGLDPVALDAWAAERILIPTARALGLDGTEMLDPRANESRGFGRWLSLSAEALQLAGHDVTMDWQDVNIHVTDGR